MGDHALTLLGLRARLAVRWVRENGFTLFVMMPLVMGGAGAIFQPYLEAAGRAGAVAWDARYAGPAVVALLVARLSSAIRDAYAIEATQNYQGLYHVVEHLLSPLDGRHASELRIDRIANRIVRHHITEIIIAFDSTLEGDTTALYLKKELAPFVSRISRLGVGLPMGSSLEYVDGGTLARAFASRQTI